jgi:hypothetical protein
LKGDYEKTKRADCCLPFLFEKFSREKSMLKI